jgi:hypothetical protein
MYLHVAGKIHSVARELFQIPEDEETRFWNKYTTETVEPLDKNEMTLQVKSDRFMLTSLQIGLSHFATSYSSPHPVC